MIELKSLEYLRNIDKKLVTSPQFMGFVFVDIKEIETNIDRIYANLPVDVLEARKINKSFEINPNTYNDLKNLEICLENTMYVFGFYRILKINEISLLIRNLYNDIGTAN